MILSLSMFLNTAIWVIQNAVSGYYFKYVVGAESLLTVFFQWMLPANIIGVVLTPILTAKFGKKNIFILGSLIVFFANVGRHFIPIPTTEVYNLFIGLSMVGSASMMFCSICQWGMVPDTIEYGHWKTGIRAEGLPLTFFTFMQKSAMAFGAGVASLVLWATGFVANTELPESALSGIKLLYNIFPGMFSLTCLIALLYYTLSKEKYDQVLADLIARSHSEYESKLKALD
jgi:GPH family glycoside/pentoside/hexuronide:cation symporter